MKTDGTPDHVLQLLPWIPKESKFLNIPATVQRAFNKRFAFAASL